MKIFYSIQNGGDGSVGIELMESQELTEWDQEHMYEGWAEDCSGYWEITGDNIVVNEEITTKESYYYNYYLSYCPENKREERKEFVEKFFNGVEPQQETKFEKDYKDYKIYKVYLNKIYAGNKWIKEKENEN